MRERTILPDEAGVLYRSPFRKVLWAFEDLSLPVAEGHSIRDVLRAEIIHQRPFFAKKHRVYLIEGRG